MLHISVSFTDSTQKTKWSKPLYICIKNLLLLYGTKIVQVTIPQVVCFQAQRENLQAHAPAQCAPNQYLLKWHARQEAMEVQFHCKSDENMCYFAAAAPKLFPTHSSCSLISLKVNLTALLLLYKRILLVVFVLCCRWGLDCSKLPGCWLKTMGLSSIWERKFYKNCVKYALEMSVKLSTLFVGISLGPLVPCWVKFAG